MLYACGYKQGYQPLVPGDLVLSGSNEVPDGFASVQDVKFPYEQEPLNLAYYYHEKSGECSPAYLYIRRAQRRRGQAVVGDICLKELDGRQARNARLQDR